MKESSETYKDYEESSRSSLVPRAAGSSFIFLELCSHLENLNYPKKAIYDILHCGEPTTIHMLASCDCSSYSIQLVRNCNKRFCLRCSKKRARKLKKRLEKYLWYYTPDSLYDFKFMSISPKNYDDLEFGLRDVLNSFRKFIRRKYIKERIKGGFCVIEVTNKEGNGWHIHLHCIIFSRRLDNVYRGSCSCGQSYLRYDKFSKKFYCANRKCNKLYEGVIEDSRLCREFMASSGRECRVDISNIHNKSSVINYCLKYVTSSKDSFSDISLFAEYVSKTYHEKLLNSFGEFSGNSVKYNKTFIPYSVFKKSQKNICHCKNCGSLIKFQFDSEISKILGGCELDV